MPAVGVVGAGTMGVGIAYVFAAAGCPTVVVEPDAGRAEDVDRVAHEQAAQGLSRGKLTPAQAEAVPTRLTVVGAVEDLPRRLDLVVESVPERMELKRSVLLAASERQPHVLATNTSALSVDELAARLPQPDAFVGMHFFNPVWSLPMVEIVRGSRTSA